MLAVCNDALLTEAIAGGLLVAAILWSIVLFICLITGAIAEFFGWKGVALWVLAVHANIATYVFVWWLSGGGIG